MLRSRTRRSAPRRRLLGLSMVELLVTAVALILALSAFLRSTVTTMSETQGDYETVVAAGAARAKMEQLIAEDFHQVFARYNGSASDDPQGVGSAPGCDFAVEGLPVREDDVDGLAGRILFPTPTPRSMTLSERVGGSVQGSARDLDLDGRVDAPDVAGSYRILPVTVRIEWRGPRGPREFSLSTILGERP